MKKWLGFLLIPFAFWGVLGCTETDTTFNTQVTSTTNGLVTTTITSLTSAPIPDMISTPQNLSIEGNLLSWDPIEGAQGYLVFVNEVETATVSLPTYDFSLLANQNLVFRVQTLAGVGKEDSRKSASVAFVLNRDQAILEMQASLLDSEISFPEEMIETLIDKGMTASEWDAFIEATNVLVSEVQMIEDVQGFYLAFHTFLETDMNMEAILHALMIHVLPPIIENEIQWREEQIDEMLLVIDEYPWQQETIDRYRSEKEIYKTLNDLLLGSSDEILLLLVDTVEYIINVQAAIDDELFTSIENLMDLESLNTITAEEALLVKDELIAVLEEDRPTVEQILLLIEVVDALSNAFVSDNDFTDLASEYKPEFAYQILSSYDLVFALLDQFDLTFFNQVKHLANEIDSEAMLQTEIKILIIIYIDRFLDFNEEMIGDLGEILTREQKEAIYSAFVSLIESGFFENDFFYLDNERMMNVIQQLEFEDFEELTQLFKASGHAFLDQFVDSNGEILRLQTIYQGFSDWGYVFANDKGYNDVLDEEYNTGSEFEKRLNEIELDLHREELLYCYEVLLEWQEEDMAVVSEVLLSLMHFDVLNEIPDWSESEAIALEMQFHEAYRTLLPSLLQLMKNVTQYMTEAEWFRAVKATSEKIYQHNVLNYGENYLENDLFWDDEYRFHAMIIQNAFLYNNFMTFENQELVYQIADIIFGLLKTNEMLILTEYSMEYVEYLEEDFIRYFEETNAIMAVIATFDADHLTEEQKDVINHDMPVPFFSFE